MMKTVAINGSPKIKDSASGIFINQIENILGTPVTVYQATQLIQRQDITATLSDILSADVLLFIFPLYVDSLPAPLVKLLTLLEQAGTNGLVPKVYAVCNCGFYEAEHTRPALDIVRNFCDCAGLAWGYGIGIGGGGFVSSRGGNMFKGPTANVYSALRELGEAIQQGGIAKQNVFVRPKIPRFLYKLGGDFSWRQMARKYGASRSLWARPHCAGVK
jgi:hypothetical protein